MDDFLVPGDSFSHLYSPALPIFDILLSENFLTVCHKSCVSDTYHSVEQGKQGSLFTSFAIYTSSFSCQRHQTRGKNIARQIGQVLPLTRLSRKQTGCTYYSIDPWKGIQIREITMWGNTRILGVIGCMQNISSFGEYRYIQDLIIKLV